MKRIPVLILSILIAICFQYCGGNNQHTVNDKDTGAVTRYPSDTIPVFRKEIKKDPVAEYRERTDNPLNNWYFSVRMYETPKTFRYLLKMEFEEISGEDTIKLPNFGIEPKPEIRKGKDKYSCIIGFLDRNNQFREYKMVYINDGTHLKLVTLNHYSVVVDEEKTGKSEQ
jgi:hypothetical protein